MIKFATRRHQRGARAAAMRALLFVLTAASCLQLSQCADPETSAPGVSPLLVGSTNPSFSSTSTLSPTVISGQSQEQAARYEKSQPPAARERTQAASIAPAATSSTGAAAAPTSTTVLTTASVEPMTTTTETKVPSSTRTTQAQQQQQQGPSQQQLANAQTTTTQAQKPASQELAQQPTTASTNSPTTSTTGNQFRYVRPQSLVPALVAAATTTSPVAAAAEPEQMMCQHNNRSFSVGQRWNDDCMQTCECILASDPAFPSRLIGISACRPRCPVYGDPPGDRCKLLRASADDCCLEWHCELDAKFAPSSARLDTSGDTSSTSGIINRSSVIETSRPITSGMVVASSQSVPMTSTTTTTTNTSTTQKPATNTSAPTTTTTTTTLNTAPTLRAAEQRRPAVTTDATITTTMASTTNLTSIQRLASSTQPIREARRQQLPANGNQQMPNNQQPAGLRTPKQVAAAAPSTSRPQRNQASLTDMIRSNEFINNEPILSHNQPVQTEPTLATADEGLEVDPLKADLCIVNYSKAWQVGADWQITACNQTCRCVFRNQPHSPLTDVYTYPTENLKPNSSKTEIRCGLPARCDQRRLIPSPECPRPRMIFSNDACACPEVTCTLLPSIQRQQEAAITTTATTIELPLESTAVVELQGCRSRNGKLMAFGETFNDECHSTCQCASDGEIRCKQLVCEPPTDHLCVEWAPVSDNFKPNSSDNKCCPGYVCKTLVPVVGSTESDFQTTSTTAVSMPPSSASSTDDANTDEQVGQPELVPDTGRNSSCMLLGNMVAHGKVVPDTIQPRGASGGESANDDTDSCERTCICDDGKIVCQPTCAPLSSEPPSDLDCPSLMSPVQLTVGCCPKWACQLAEPYALQSFNVRTVNASTAEVIISLPDFAVNQSGKIDLSYTSLPVAVAAAAESDTMDEPPANAVWLSRHKIRTRDGLFSRRKINYLMSDLKPDHKYWLKVFVHFENGPYKRPIESPLQSVVMPPAAPTVRPSTSPSSQSVPVSSVDTTSSNISTTTTARLPQPMKPIVPNRAQPPSNRLATSTTQSPTTTSITTSTSAASPTTATMTTTTTTTQRPSSSSTTSTFSPSTSTTTTKPVAPYNIRLESEATNIKKPEVGQLPDDTQTSCKNSTDYPLLQNHVDLAASSRSPGADSLLDNPLSYSGFLTEQIHNAPIQRYAWHLLVALAVMTVLFLLVSYLYCKKSRVIAPITSPHYPHHGGQHGHHHQSAYDNPTFTKLVSYYANQPHVLLIDESNQNFDNLTKQKNMEVDKSSPLNHQANNNNNNNIAHANHRHITTPVHHNQNGRQHLI